MNNEIVEAVSEALNDGFEVYVRYGDHECVSFKLGMHPHVAIERIAKVIDKEIDSIERSQDGSLLLYVIQCK